MTMRITPLDKWIKEKTNLDKLTADALRGYQLEKLRSIIRYAKARGRFYSGHFVTSCEIETFSDFEALPYTTADDISRNPYDFLCVPPDEVSRIVTLHTSGTTGGSKRVFFTQEDQELTVEFFRHGMSTFTLRGERVLLFMPGESPGGVGDLLTRGLARLDAETRVYGPITDYEDAHRALLEYDPRVLVGLPSQLCRLARETAGLVRLKSVLLASDYISPALATAIGECWGCGVFMHYGLTESGLGGAVSCQAHAGYHMRENDLYFEIIDPATGRMLPDGEYGEVVFTTLNRSAMPLIRFRTGDCSRILAAPCPCGSGLRRFERIIGRINEPVRLRSGYALSITELDDILYKYPEITAFSADLTDDGNGDETLIITIKLRKDSAPLPTIPELYSLPVKVITKKGAPDIPSSGVIKRCINSSFHDPYSPPDLLRV
jgi:phenylacetate-coenzyme A ligase PaaK-like adenylate-forming protein